jgi:hypothetical protein
MRTRSLALTVLALAGATAASADEVRVAPPYRDAPEMAAHPGEPRGTLHSFIMRSTESSIYPGIRQLDTETTRRRDPYENRLPAPPRGFGAGGAAICTGAVPTRGLRLYPGRLPGGHGGAVAGRAGWPRLYGARRRRARQPDRAAPRSADGRGDDPVGRRRCARIGARPRIRHRIGSLCTLCRDGGPAARDRAVRRPFRKGSERACDDGRHSPTRRAESRDRQGMPGSRTSPNTTAPCRTIPGGTTPLSARPPRPSCRPSSRARSDPW